jgi:hypothetical protein
MAQLYTNDVDFTKVFPMKTKSEAPDTLVAVMQDVGIPSALHSDDAKELTQGRMGEIMRKAWIKPTQSEPYSPWQVRAELCNRELKKAVCHALYRTNAPGRLWDYCTAYHSEIRNLTAHPHYNLQGRTPYELVTGNTPDISQYTDFAWYDNVWYFDQEAAFPENRKKLAKWLGVAHTVGQALCYYLLPPSGKPIVRSTVQPVSHDELKDPIVQNISPTLSSRSHPMCLTQPCHQSTLMHLFYRMFMKHMSLKQNNLKLMTSPQKPMTPSWQPKSSCPKGTPWSQLWLHQENKILMGIL